MIEKGWLGGGNTGRNTTTIRSNYFYPESVALYDFSLKLYEGLSRELNYNIMLSQRGVVTVAHSDAEMEIAARIVNAMQINGTDAELLGPDGVLEKAPLLNGSDRARYPIFGGAGRAGRVLPATTRSPGAMRAPPMQPGTDIIQNCEVTGFIVESGRCVGVETTQGAIRADTIGLCGGRPFRRARRPRPASSCRSAPIRCRPWCRSRSSRAGPLTVEPGWHDGWAATPADDVDAVLEIGGAGLQALVAEATSADLDGGSPSAAIMFAGIACLLYRTGQTIARLHVERPLATYVWHWLETRGEADRG